MRTFFSRILCLVVLLLLFIPIANAAAQNGYSRPSTNPPDRAPQFSLPVYWQETTLVYDMATRSGPGGNGVYTEELATFRLGTEIDRNAKVLVGWKEPSSPHPRTGVVNGVYWALVEFRDINGNLYRAYVGIDSPTQKPTKQRLAVNPDTVPYEDFSRVDCEIYTSTRMYYGPGTNYKEVTHRNNYRDTGNEIMLPVGTDVQYLCDENNFALIEFSYPSWLSSPSNDSGPLMRAWVPMYAIWSK